MFAAMAAGIFPISYKGCLRRVIIFTGAKTFGFEIFLVVGAIGGLLLVAISNIFREF
jgi:hypothetical protein